MTDKTPDNPLSRITKAMKDIDFVMLNTHGEGGAIAGRPMSNNREVDYDGDSYYFTWDDSRMVADIGRDPQVSLSFQGKTSLLGAPGIFIAVQGTADIVRDKAEFAKHWSKDLERWFEQGIDTEGLVMLHVRATRVAYWDSEEQEDFVVG